MSSELRHYRYSYVTKVEGIRDKHGTVLGVEERTMIEPESKSKPQEGACNPPLVPCKKQTLFLIAIFYATVISLALGATKRHRLLSGISTAL